MKKINIEIPQGIRFLSDWNEFNFSKFPSKCIINKQIPGCGFTEYCIRSNEDIILCSPRKILLKNKYDQHKDEVYLVVNELDRDPVIDKDISKNLKAPNKNTESDTDISTRKVEIYKELYLKIEQYVDYRRSQMFKPLKILVTYDSYHIVVDILNKLGIYNNFYTVIDEFQSILHDSRFKSSTELRFLNIIKRQSHSALFVSATPMMDEYLDMLEDFKDLPYYEMDWHTQDPSRVIRPSLKILTMKSVNTKAEEIIKSYLQGNFESLVVMREGKPVRVISDEAVLYVNSVNHIISIIKRCDLVPDQCNILCADTEENRNKVKRRLGKGFSIGSVPLRGEKPKMFTFCTRTVYLGADFYSLCARSFIFSDSNSDCLAVDISEDLPQILGRQRLFDNPWKNSATFYYRYTADYKKMSKDDLDKIIDRKKVRTEKLVRTYHGALEVDKQVLAEKYKEGTESTHYRNDYVAVDYFDGVAIPVLNNLVLVNEIRSFRIQQIDYASRFAVFSTVHNQLTQDDIVNQEAHDFLERYCAMTEARKKMIFLCEASIQGIISQDAINIILGQIPDDDYIKSYYITLGPQKLKALRYTRSNIEKALGIITFSDDLLKQRIYNEFKKGEKYTLANLKTKLGSLYSSINYNSTPRASDIESWFIVKEISIYDKNSDGSRRKNRGYELLEPRQ